jgi:tetratricopeptide (TPR) repeat protein
VAADRFMYLPLAGLALGTTRSLASLLSRGRALIVAVALAVVTGSLGVATWLRADDWTDEITFWSNTYRHDSRGNGVACVELGNIFFRAGLHLQAIGVYQSYHDVDEFNRAMSANNMATSLQAIGRYEAAHRVLSQIVQWFPSIPKFRVNLAFAELSIGDFAAARRELDETLRLYPGHELARTVRKDLPRLEKAGKVAYGDSAQDLLAQAKYSVETGRNYDAFRFMERALSREKLPRAQADGALYFALKFADPAVTARIFEGYVRSAGGRAPEAVIEAQRARVESGRRLLEIWPSLGLPLPKFGK